MKTLTTSILAGLLIVGLGAFGLAQNNQSQNQGQSSFLDVCPWHSSHSSMMSANMMGGMMMRDCCASGNSRMQRGMMHSMMPGTMMRADSTAICPWDVAEFNAWKQRANVSTPLNQETARRWAEYYVAAYHNPDLVIGKIKEKDNGFEVEIRSKKENKVLEKIFVDKNSGWISKVK